MGTPLLKNAGVSNVVPAFRRKFPEALLLADMKTMDGGGFEARAVYAGGGNVAPVQVVGGLSVAQAKNLAQSGVRAFVISGNLGQPDGRARYDLPADQIQRYVADFIAEVSRA
jgi:3-keto-L-gulonate-6-phosphate decarboxylase